VFNVKGGIKAWQGHTAAGPPEMGMILLAGNEPPAEIVVLSYGLEQSLQMFYANAAESVPDAEVAGLLRRLAGIEIRHKQKLYRLYASLVSPPVEEEKFASQVETRLMEGGFAVDEFMRQHRGELQSVEAVLTLAMTIEAQAMDLYARFADRTMDEEGKNILLGLADEEKSHLARLGELMPRARAG
jgi:rubrerythrin